MANPFKEAEERKRQEAEARKKREAEEAAKKAESAEKTENTTVVPVQEIPEVVPVKEEPQVVPVAPVTNAYEMAASALREQMDAQNEKLEKKVPVNVMIKPSLKRKVEQDIRNKKVKSMSQLITSLLEQYYK